MFSKKINNISESVRRTPYVSLLLGALALGIHLIYPLRMRFMYHRSLFNWDECCRIFSCHFVHLNWDHLLWSGMTFLVLGLLCELTDRKGYMKTIGLSCVFIFLAVHYGLPDLDAYAGLSGVDCALYAFLVVNLIRKSLDEKTFFESVFYAVFFIGLIGKILYEAATGRTLFVGNCHPGMVAVPLAHLAGGAVGTALALLVRKHPAQLPDDNTHDGAGHAGGKGPRNNGTEAHGYDFITSFRCHGAQSPDHNA